MTDKTFNYQAFIAAYQLIKRRCLGNKSLLRKRTQGMLFHVEERLKTDPQNSELLEAKKALQR